MKEILKSMNEAEPHEEKEREEQKRLTSWDYIRRGNRAYSKENYKKAYLNCARSYRAIGGTSLAEQDEEYAAGIETK